MNNQLSSKVIALIFGVIVLLFSVGFYIFAWQEPAQAPPLGNASTSINVSSTAQIKAGDLTIGISQIKADGSVGTNLNSDRVDDYHSADLMAAGGGGGGAFELSCGWFSPNPSVGSCTPKVCPTGYQMSTTSCEVSALAEVAPMNGVATCPVGYTSNNQACPGTSCSYCAPPGGCTFYSPCVGGSTAMAGRCYVVCYK
jgi:hypothetical protein